MYIFKNPYPSSNCVNTIFIIALIALSTTTKAEPACNTARLTHDSEGARYQYDKEGEYKHLLKVTHNDYIATFNYHQNGRADKIIISYPGNENYDMGTYEVRFTHSAKGKLTAINTLASNNSTDECPNVDQYKGNITFKYDTQERITPSSSRSQEACSQNTDLIELKSDVIDIRYNEDQLTGYTTKEFLNNGVLPLGDSAVFDIEKSSCGFAKKNLIGPFAVGGISTISKPSPLQQTVSFKPHNDLMIDNQSEEVLVGTYASTSCTRANIDLEKDLELWSYFDTSYGSFDYSFLRLELCM